MKQRYYSLKSPLRPVYAGYFPTFNNDELEMRKEKFEPHIATLLYPPNIISFIRLYGKRWWKSYLEKGDAERCDDLLGVLKALGVSRQTLAAMRRIPRHSFAPDRFRRYAYLNWSIPIVNGSCLSSPGIVALMCDEAPQQTHGNCIEVGGGTGYHSCVLAARCPQLRIIAYEACIPVASLGQELVQEWGDGRVDLIGACFQTGDRGNELAMAYHTAANPEGALPGLFPALREEGIYTYIRPLTEAEYSQSPKDTWLHTLYSTYQDYKSNGWARICVLSTAVKRGTLQERYHLYGVTFVSWRAQPELGSPEINNPVLDQLMTL